MSQLDFDGDYGRRYRQTIQDAIPGHSTLLEIATATMGHVAARAQRLLVVGPGPGDELVQLLDACPDAEIVALEPSDQMIRACQESLQAHHSAHRCRLVPQTLEDATRDGVLTTQFDAVICHNVLHLFPAERQDVTLQALIDQLRPGGLLLLSSYSESASPEVSETLLGIASQRLSDRGLAAETIEQIRTTRGTAVFSLDEQRLESALLKRGCEAPTRLYQGLLTRLWLAQKREVVSPT